MGKFIILTKKSIVSLGITLIGTLSFFVLSIFFLDNTLEVANSNRLLPIYSVETDKKQVALTFDCAWGADDITEIVEVLKKNNVKATFFVVGDWVEKHPKAIQTLNQANMEIRQSHVKSCTCCANDIRRKFRRYEVL